MSIAGFAAPVERLGRYIGDHQYVAGIDVLCNRRNEAIVAKIDSDLAPIGSSPTGIRVGSHVRTKATGSNSPFVSDGFGTGQSIVLEIGGSVLSGLEAATDPEGVGVTQLFEFDVEFAGIAAISSTIPGIATISSDLPLRCRGFERDSGRFGSVVSIV